MALTQITTTEQAAEHLCSGFYNVGGVYINPRLIVSVDTDPLSFTTADGTVHAADPGNSADVSELLLEALPLLIASRSVSAAGVGT